MENGLAHLDTLLELENRHEELLQRLDDLDRRVEKVLKENQPSRCGGGIGGEPAVERPPE